MLIERKTAGDLLSSIKDGRLIAQAGFDARGDQWTYLVVTGPMYPGSYGQVLHQPSGAHAGPARDRVGLSACRGR